MFFKPRLIPTLFTIPALLVLLFLGGWQIQRMIWKEALIEKLHMRAMADPVFLPASELDMEQWEFRQVKMRGTYVNEHEFFLLNRSLNGNPGFHILVPFRRADVPDEQVILVNRGWVPFGKEHQTQRAEGILSEQITITAMVRFPRKLSWLQRMLIPENNPVTNNWYSVDIHAMSRVFRVQLAPYYLLDNNDQVAGMYPVGRQWNIDVPNNHLEYAITWFLLALALVVIYACWHLQRERELSREKRD